MRFHLLIQRHGIPATRILWTTSPPSLFGAEARSLLSNPSSSRPNTGYTIAQFLEDVNEVIPLETEVGLFENESGGQWGLEDYVVEVGGSECLHFMEVDGLLRDGDEVVIRALQLPDLRARRLSGRHQISVDGKHLIDGVPFGRPFLRRSVSSRPGITIPPRKKRRTLLSRWGRGMPSDEEDAEWEPRHLDAADQLALIPGVHSDEDSMVHHDVRGTEDDQVSESDADESDVDDEDLADELRELKEDLGSGAHEPATADESRKYSLRAKSAREEGIRRKPTHPALSTRPASETPQNLSPKVQKSVRFSEEKATAVLEVRESSDESRDSISDSSSSETSSDDDSDSDSSASDSSEERDLEEENAARAKRRKINPPGAGSAQTKKSNRRNKMRRRLAKLKELGVLAEDADFAALRTFDDTYKGQIPIPDPRGKPSAKEIEQAEFEAKRQKLLRDLESGGIDVDATSEKENVPPEKNKGGRDHAEGVVCDTLDHHSETATEPVKKRLDVASTRRLLFGSLGVRTPRSKEDEEATREKLAGKVRQIQPRRDAEEKSLEEPVSEPEVDWQDRLILRATECVVDGIQLKDPPFPFRQRWDFEAQNIIRRRMGMGTKRKRDRGLQLDGEAEEQEYDDSYVNGEELSYDDSYVNGEEHTYDIDAADNVGRKDNADTEDLPRLPDNMSSLVDLVESEMKKGMVIAFKQLDMSKATNWQPRISEYRIAEVHGDPEDGVFEIRLAKRDRQQRENGEGEEGERRYTGFEMPGFEDEEDDGFREVAFADLIEPKILRVVDVGVGEEVRNPVQPVSEDIGAGTTSEVRSTRGLAQDQLQDQDADPKENQEKLADETEELSASPVIRSPAFAGFHTSSSEMSSDDSSDDDQSPPANQEANDEPRLSLSNQDAASSSSSSSPSSIDRQLNMGREIINSPKSASSFDRILDDFIQGNRREGPLDNEQNGEESAPSQPSDEFVPNPLPELAQPAERHASEDLQDSLNDEDLAKLLSGPGSSDDHNDPEQQKSDESIAESDWPGEDESPQPQQPQMGDVVDLTQDSPAESLDGHNDVVQSEGLPRGPGWVQKSAPASQRETRSRARVQVMKEVSISPTSKGRRR